MRYEGKHIIFYILEEYFNNFEKMLKDKNGNYVNVNYLKEVYMLFFQSTAFKISRKEEELLNDKDIDFDKEILQQICQPLIKHAMLNKNYYDEINFEQFLTNSKKFNYDKIYAYIIENNLLELT